MSSSVVLLLPMMSALSVVLCWFAGTGLAALLSPAPAPRLRPARQGRRS